jgi:hypothetical protein
MEKLKVLHLFISKSRVHFIRTLLLPTCDTIDYYVATYKMSSSVNGYKDRDKVDITLDPTEFKIVPKRYSFADNIRRNKFFNGTLIYYSTIENLKTTIEYNKLKFDVVLISDGPEVETLHIIYDVFGYLPQVFFVSHGITVINVKQPAFNSWNPYFTYICSGPKIIDILTKPVRFAGGNIYPRRVFEIKGLPQFDYMMLMSAFYKDKHNQVEIRKELDIPVDGKTILVIIGIDGNMDGIVKMIDLIHEKFPDYYIILRNKTCNFSFPDKYTYIRLSSLSRMSYDYFFADINIVYIGGTSFIECLTYNPRTINYQCDNVITKREAVCITGYKYLLTSNDEDEFKKHMELVKTNYVFTKEYVDDVKRYMMEFCNTECIEYVSDKIIDIIIKEHKENPINKKLQKEAYMYIKKENEIKKRIMRQGCVEEMKVYKNPFPVVKDPKSYCSYIPSVYDIQTADHYINLIFKDSKKNIQPLPLEVSIIDKEKYDNECVPSQHNEDDDETSQTT